MLLNPLLQSPNHGQPMCCSLSSKVHLSISGCPSERTHACSNYQNSFHEQLYSLTVQSTGHLALEVFGAERAYPFLQPFCNLEDTYKVTSLVRNGKWNFLVCNSSTHLKGEGRALVLEESLSSREKIVGPKQKSTFAIFNGLIKKKMFYLKCPGTFYNKTKNK